MVCDSNVIIDYLNGDREVINVLRGWKQEGRQLLISPITITEVLGLSRLSKKELEIAGLFLQEFTVVSLDAATAEYAGSLCRSYSMKTPDSLIAATAIRQDVPLVSRDKQFRKIKELELIAP